jgi:hypothetical protein|tara:strand:- start:163 stop:471 length:309 start_codon:yes stop_codon:yes gene_type:complete
METALTLVSLDEEGGSVRGEYQASKVRGDTQLVEECRASLRIAKRPIEEHALAALDTTLDTLVNTLVDTSLVDTTLVDTLMITLMTTLLTRIELDLVEEVCE